MMKRKVMKLTAFFLLLCFVFSFASCIKSSEAKALTEEIFSCLSEERYEDAAALFHPSYGITASEMEATAKALADVYDADVKNGIIIKRTTGMNSAAYTTEVDGSRYEMRMVVQIGEKELDAVIVIVSNDSGYGVSRLTFEE